MSSRAATSEASSFNSERSIPLISTGDRHIGQVTLFGLSPYTFTKQTTKLKVPRNVAPGTYYVGWIASTGFAEYNSGDNSGAIDIVGGNNESIIVSPYDVDVNLSYASGTLGTRFSVSNPKPATWNATFVAQNGLASLFSTLVPVNATAAQFPVDIPLAPSGNVGIFTTLVSSGKIVDVDWSTIDTAPPTTHTCAIEGTASYSDSTIRADLRLTMPMSALLTWKVWRITALGQDVLLSTPIFAAGSYPRSLTVAQAGSSGIVGLLATATSSAEGIVCSRLIRVNTGG